MRPVLQVEGLTKRYGSAAVVEDVSFQLPRGTVTLLTGRSGSGKSTIFRLVAALDRPTAGRIFLDGEDMTGLDDASLAELRLRRLGLVFQSFNLLPDLSARENVRLPLDLAGAPRKAADARAAELLSLVGLDARANARPALLSGGEQQRVAVARALVNQPALLLADEPTANLDRKSADMVFGLLQDVNRSLGTTMLIITHDEVAPSWFSRRLDLEEGRLTEPGASPSLDRPGVRSPLPPPR